MRSHEHTQKVPATRRTPKKSRVSERPNSKTTPVSQASSHRLPAEISFLNEGFGWKIAH